MMGCSEREAVIMFDTVVAKKHVPQSERNSTSPQSGRKWLNDIISCLFLEEIRDTSANCDATVVQIWGF